MSMVDAVRPARPTDASAIRRLQSLLAEPAPALLAAALADLGDDVGSTTTAPSRPPSQRPRLGDAFRLLVSVADVDTDPDSDVSTTDDTDIATTVTEDRAPGGRPVGYLLALTGGGTHIAELAVHPDFRRAGRARALCRRLVATAERPISVHVAADNAAARACYESVGFRVVARAEDRFETASGLTLRYDGSGGFDGGP